MKLLQKRVACWILGQILERVIYGAVCMLRRLHDIGEIIHIRSLYDAMGIQRVKYVAPAEALWGLDREDNCLSSKQANEQHIKPFSAIWTDLHLPVLSRWILFLSSLCHS